MSEEKKLLPESRGFLLERNATSVTWLLEQFVLMVRQKTKPEIPGSAQILQSAVIAAKEAGELLDVTNRLHYYEQPLDFVRDGQTHEQTLLEECGDILFGVQGVLATQGLTILDAMEHNIYKLMQRYTAGFTTAEAAQRADKVPEEPELPGLTD